MLSKYILVASLSIFLACNANQSNNSNGQVESKEAEKPDINEEPTKFGLSEDVISKINNEMGLGNLLAWQNDADPGEKPSYFTTLEYEIKPPKESIVNSNNVIELSIGSKGATGKYVEYLDLTVGFMNPEDEKNAKKLFVQKVNLLSKVFGIEIPTEIQEAVKREQNLKVGSGDYQFEVEVYGAARKWMTLHIKTKTKIE